MSATKPGMAEGCTTKLTAQVKAGGCASKLSPKILDQVLPLLPRVADPNLLVGFDTSDDAGVYRLTPDLAIVQTVDFFTPMVDDPFIFGAIAAANALSDVYAMGGKPLTALSILAWPAASEVTTLADLEAILKGGASKIHEAGAVVVGGHSVNDPEIKFGFAVTGVIHPDRIKTNCAARPGDVLVFTKKIGTGVISTALKRGIASDAHIEGAIASMVTLNRAAAEAMEDLEIHSVTDVTGFGLLGHAREMAMGSGVTLEIDSSLVRFLDGAAEYAKAGAIPGGLNNNREFVSSCVESNSPVADLLYDPQTSGGLLISLPEADAASYMRKYEAAYRIGRAIERGAKPLRVI
jgi:selenide,water dikinase